MKSGRKKLGIASRDLGSFRSVRSTVSILLSAPRCSPTRRTRSGGSSAGQDVERCSFFGCYAELLRGCSLVLIFVLCRCCSSSYPMSPPGWVRLAVQMPPPARLFWTGYHQTVKIGRFLFGDPPTAIRLLSLSVKMFIFIFCTSDFRTKFHQNLRKK